MIKIPFLKHLISARVLQCIILVAILFPTIQILLITMTYLLKVFINCTKHQSVTQDTRLKYFLLQDLMIQEIIRWIHYALSTQYIHVDKNFDSCILSKRFILFTKNNYLKPADCFNICCKNNLNTGKISSYEALILVLRNSCYSKRRGFSISIVLQRATHRMQSKRVLIRQNVHKYLYTCLKLLTRELSYYCLSLYAVRPFAAFAGIKGLTLISCRPSLLAGYA